MAIANSRTLKNFARLTYFQSLFPNPPARLLLQPGLMNTGLDHGAAGQSRKHALFILPELAGVQLDNVPPADNPLQVFLSYTHGCKLDRLHILLIGPPCRHFRGGRVAYFGGLGGM